jgi:FKBP-type peptidyl-prolyl cis-trans isomerase
LNRQLYTRVFTCLLMLMLTEKFHLASAQCDGCDNIPAESIDFCYKRNEFDGFCASFSYDIGYFFLQNKSAKISTPRKVNCPPALTNTDAWLLSLQSDNTLKCTTKEILFISHAWESWNVMDALYHWDTVALSNGWTMSPSGLAWQVIRQGNGKMPQLGKRISVYFNGWLSDGTEFDNSQNQHQALSFTPGNREVIVGLEEILVQFPVGTTLLLRIPPELGYGANGMPPVIPPNSTLYYRINILSTA